jgi:CheY-like chemotaxis protein
LVDAVANDCAMTRPAPIGTLSMPTLHRRVLLLGGCAETNALLGHLVGVAMPEARVVVDEDWGRSGTKPKTRLISFDLAIVDAAVDAALAITRVESMTEQESAPPVLFFTASSDTQLAARARAAGATAVLARDGISVGALSEQLQTLCREARPRQEETGRQERSDGLLRPHGRRNAIIAAVPLERLIRNDDPPTQMPLVPGYDVLAEIGRGGMASALLAQREEDNVLVVLKLLRVSEAHNATNLRRFLREFRIAAQLEHPNIVTTYERAFASDFAYIAMEYCAGGDLQSRIAAGLDVTGAINHARAIASALGAAHAKAVIHRDVKPANVLFRADDSLVLSDFGIAKAKEAAVSLTLANALMGTPHYISPEQIRGGAVDHRADLYSLGVILFEMLAGARPFRGERIVDLLEAHVSTRVPRLPDEAVHMQPVVDRLMAKRPEDRYQSADELIDALDSVEG